MHCTLHPQKRAGKKTMFLLPVVALAAAACAEDDVYERVYSVQNLHDEADVLWLRSEAGSSSVGRVFDAVAKHDASRLQTRRAAAAGILPAYFFFGPRGAAKERPRPRVRGSQTIDEAGIANRTQVVVCNTRELRDSELCGGLVDESYWAALEAAFAEDRGAVDGDPYDADARLALACALGDRNHFPQAKVELRESLRGGADAARLALGRVMVVAAILDGGGRRPDFMADVRALVDDVDGTMAFGARVAGARAGRVLRSECAGNAPDVSVIAKALAAGADVLEADAHGRVPVVLAASAGHAKLLKILCGTAAPPAPALAIAAKAAAADGDAAVLEALVAHCGLPSEALPPRSWYARDMGEERRRVEKFLATWSRSAAAGAAAAGRGAVGRAAAALSAARAAAARALGGAEAAARRAYDGARGSARRAVDGLVGRAVAVAAAARAALAFGVATCVPSPLGFAAVAAPFLGVLAANWRSHRPRRDRAWDLRDDARGRYLEALDREIDALRSPKRGARDPPAQAAALLDEARRLLRDVRDARDPAPAARTGARRDAHVDRDPPGAAAPATPARKAARSLEALAALRELDPRALPNDALEVVDELLPELTRKVAREIARRASRVQATDLTECVVCLEDSRQVAFSCGHLCVCEACAADIAECPLCRSPVRTKRRIYFD